MAGTPSKSDPRVVRDYLRPRKFLKDMRARARANSRPKGRRSSAR